MGLKTLLKNNFIPLSEEVDVDAEGVGNGSSGRGPSSAGSSECDLDSSYNSAMEAQGVDSGHVF